MKSNELTRVASFAALNQDDLENLAVRGSRLFAFGHDLDRHGHSLGADQVYQQAISLLENGFAGTQKLLSPSQFAQIAIRHGQVLFTLRRFSSATAAFRRAVELLEESRADGVSTAAIELLARSYSWLGHAEFMANRADSAVETFRTARLYWRSLLKIAPQSKVLYYRRALVSTCFGSSKALEKSGKNEQAQHYRELAFELRRLLKKQ